MVWLVISMFGLMVSVAVAAFGPRWLVATVLVVDTIIFLVAAVPFLALVLTEDPYGVGSPCLDCESDGWAFGGIVLLVVGPSFVVSAFTLLARSTDGPSVAHSHVEG